MQSFHLLEDRLLSWIAIQTDSGGQGSQGLRSKRGVRVDLDFFSWESNPERVFMEVVSILSVSFYTTSSGTLKECILTLFWSKVSREYETDYLLVHTRPIEEECNKTDTLGKHEFYGLGLRCK